MHCILGVKKTVKATERAAGVLNVWWREKGGRVEKKNTAAKVQGK